MYPVSLDIKDKLCVVVGGGHVAARKVRGILAAGGRVRIISPELSARLDPLKEKREVEWRRKVFEAGDLAGAFLVFAATNDPEAQAAIVEAARGRNLLVNVADCPEICDFQIPAVLRRGDLSISVATNGKTPAVAAMVRKRLETVIGEEYGLLTTLVAVLRDEIIQQATSEVEKKKLFQKILQDDIVLWLRERQWHRVRQHLENVLGRPLGGDLERLFKENP
ncbi:MAG: bifunctional precorrin-2 dehydrogenase/sirohydrochlorin ferrochelatase [Clostridia bacterium]|jgi:precorrin-2 dehydrogenase/sirohydrochlorin ferrochelatase|nr:bifunctional precorrin-2 dehydrogenase/sirohydrochlorin ferrochelatase [Clostridia bacterium]